MGKRKGLLTVVIQSAQGGKERIYIGDKVRLIGEAPAEIGAWPIETVFGFKPDKKSGIQLINSLSRHWIGMPAKYYEVVERGPNFPTGKK